MNWMQMQYQPFQPSNSVLFATINERLANSYQAQQRELAEMATPPRPVVFIRKSKVEPPKGVSKFRTTYEPFSGKMKRRFEALNKRLKLNECITQD